MPCLFWYHVSWLVTWITGIRLNRQNNCHTNNRNNVLKKNLKDRSMDLGCSIQQTKTLGYLITWRDLNQFILNRKISRNWDNGDWSGQSSVTNRGSLSWWIPTLFWSIPTMGMCSMSCGRWGVSALWRQCWWWIAALSWSWSMRGSIPTLSRRCRIPTLGRSRCLVMRFRWLVARMHFRPCVHLQGGRGRGEVGYDSLASPQPACHGVTERSVMIMKTTQLRYVLNLLCSWKCWSKTRSWCAIAQIRRTRRSVICFDNNNQLFLNYVSTQLEKEFEVSPKPTLYCHESLILTHLHH